MRKKTPTAKTLALSPQHAAAFASGLTLGLAAAVLAWAILAARL